MIIALDFDGTCVKHEYPKIGASIGSESTIKELYDNGHNIILFTMRSGKELDDAVKWMEDLGIKLYGINTNPTQSEWTKSPKAYAQMYIDDCALGIPLITNPGERPYVNWKDVRIMIAQMGLINFA